MRVSQAVTSALSLGVPLFNGGDAAGCYEVYADAARSILPQVSPAVRAALSGALTDCESQSQPADRAWTMRRALDYSMEADSRGAAPWPIDFSDPSVAADFAAVDDRIMGGSSQSRVIFADGVTVFEGLLVEQGGGFASVRYGPPLTLDAATDALLLEARGDGRQGYKLTLTSGRAPNGISYQAAIDAGSGGFAALRLPLASFKPSYRGRPAPEAPALRAADVRSLGLMLSRFDVGGGEKGRCAGGPFRLELRRLGSAESELATNGRRWV